MQEGHRTMAAKQGVGGCGQVCRHRCWYIPGGHPTCSQIRPDVYDQGIKGAMGVSAAKVTCCTRIVILPALGCASILSSPNLTLLYSQATSGALCADGRQLVHQCGGRGMCHCVVMWVVAGWPWRACLVGGAHSTPMWVRGQGS